jgi:hypoxanthine phosphoribosyltransferase
MKRKIERILIGRDEIRAKVRELGSRLSEDLSRDLQAEGHQAEDHPDRVVMIPVMTGAMVFCADLIREMPLQMSIRVVSVSSYPGESTRSRGARLRGSIPDDLGGRHVVLIDDILDSGQTLQMLQDLVREKSPASVRTCVLLLKDVPRVAEADLWGFEIPDEFVVGYGLDYDGFYRNLPDIATLGAP